MSLKPQGISPVPEETARTNTVGYLRAQNRRSLPGDS
jgi:hypothetical protein